jgi:hypothetical protein
MFRPGNDAESEWWGNGTNNTKRMSNLRRIFEDMPTLGRIHTDIFKSFSGFGPRIRMVKKRSHALPHPIR